MSEVIEHNFGKEDREHAQRLARLLGLFAGNDADILANPGKYLAMASRRLAEHERFINQLYDALHLPWAPSGEPFSEVLAPSLPPPAMQIDRRDYEALQALKPLIENAWHRGSLSDRDAQAIDPAGGDVTS